MTTANEMKNVAVNSLEGYTLTLKYWVSRDALDQAMRVNHSETNRTVTILIDRAELVIRALEQATSLTIACQSRDRAALKAGQPYTDHWKLSELIGAQGSKKASSGLSPKAQECLKIHKKLIPLLGEEAALIACAAKYPMEIIEELREAGNIPK